MIFSSDNEVDNDINIYYIIMCFNNYIMLYFCVRLSNSFVSTRPTKIGTKIIKGRYLNILNLLLTLYILRHEL